MRETIRYTWVTTALGRMLLAASAGGIVALHFAGSPAEEILRTDFPDADLVLDRDALDDLARKAAAAIETPAAGSALPLDLRGSHYEVAVWHMLREIPLGETTSYGALAARLGTRDAREVTEAIAANPVAVLVPCHRVIRKDGSLSGYRWGVWRKRALLKRERAAVSGREPASLLL